MKQKKFRLYGLVCLVSALLLAACNPLRINESVLVCLPAGTGPADMRGFMLDLSLRHGFEFEENGDQVARDLRATGGGAARILPDDPLHAGLYQRRQVVMKATNLGLDDHEILVSFARRDTQAELERFKDDVIAELSERWDTRVFDGSPGIIKGTCSSSSG
ncbi:hypothetical protein [Maricaulis sp.]|uniref:hypothetical protein n=1 Tax=Maricaulis sp. TaxID=1486257 RepID=UPI003A8F5E00